MIPAKKVGEDPIKILAPDQNGYETSSMEILRAAATPAP